MPKYDLAKRPGFPNWYIVWSDRGRSKRRTTGEKDRGKAQLVFAAFLQEMQRPARDDLSVASAMTDYLDRHAARLPSKVQAELAGKLLMEHYRGKPVSAVTLQTQDDYIAKRCKDVGDETIARELSVLRAALNRAKKYGRIDNVPHVISLRRAPARERFLTRKEAARLLRACVELHLRNFVRLALYTGARRGAILDLTWDRVDFDHRRIEYPLPGRVETNKRRAVVPFDGALFTALARTKKRTRSKYVIAYQGHRVASIKTAFKAACKRAKLKGVSPHTLRHTAATWAAQSGEDLWRIAGMLGHESLRMTERYAKHQPDYLKSTSQAMLRGRAKVRAN